MQHPTEITTEFLYNETRAVPVPTSMLRTVWLQPGHGAYAEDAVVAGENMFWLLHAGHEDDPAAADKVMHGGESIGYTGYMLFVDDEMLYSDRVSYGAQQALMRELNRLAREFPAGAERDIFVHPHARGVRTTLSTTDFDLKLHEAVSKFAVSNPCPGCLEATLVEIGAGVITPDDEGLAVDYSGDFL